MPVANVTRRLRSAGPDRGSRPAPRWRKATVKSTADGIYGVIVGASVMGTSHAATAAGLALSVLFTLMIYWAAERYARLVAQRIHAGRRPRWAEARRELTAGWEIVTASTLPLAVLVGLRMAGLNLTSAVNIALGCSTGLLCLAGWLAGRDGRLTTPERLVSTAAAGAFGLSLIVLKALPH
jgi:TRAP-type C4-dicarboxylate transport system permease large subunit